MTYLKRGAASGLWRLWLFTFVSFAADIATSQLLSKQVPETINLPSRTKERRLDYQPTAEFVRRRSQSATIESMDDQRHLNAVKQIKNGGSGGKVSNKDKREKAGGKEKKEIKGSKVNTKSMGVKSKGVTKEKSKAEGMGGKKSISPTAPPPVPVTTAVPVAAPVDTPVDTPVDIPVNVPVDVPSTEAPAATPEGPVLRIRVDNFFLAYVAPDAIEPTEEQYSQLVDITNDFFQDILTEKFANDTAVAFLRAESTLGFTLFDAGIPAERFNIYTNYNYTDLIYTADSAPPDAEASFVLLRESINRAYITDYVRSLIDTPFITTNEVVFR